MCGYEISDNAHLTGEYDSVSRSSTCMLVGAIYVNATTVSMMWRSYLPIEFRFCSVYECVLNNNLQRVFSFAQIWGLYMLFSAEVVDEWD